MPLVPAVTSTSTPSAALSDGPASSSTNASAITASVALESMRNGNSAIAAALARSEAMDAERRLTKIHPDAVQRVRNGDNVKEVMDDFKLVKIKDHLVLLMESVNGPAGCAVREGGESCVAVADRFGIPKIIGQGRKDYDVPYTVLQAEALKGVALQRVLRGEPVNNVAEEHGIYFGGLLASVAVENSGRARVLAGEAWHTVANELGITKEEKAHRTLQSAAITGLAAPRFEAGERCDDLAREFRLDDKGLEELELFAAGGRAAERVRSGETVDGVLGNCGISHRGLARDRLDMLNVKAKEGGRGGVGEVTETAEHTSVRLIDGRAVTVLLQPSVSETLPSGKATASSRTQIRPMVIPEEFHTRARHGTPVDEVVRALSDRYALAGEWVVERLELSAVNGPLVESEIKAGRSATFIATRYGIRQDHGAFQILLARTTNHHRSARSDDIHFRVARGASVGQLTAGAVELSEDEIYRLEMIVINGPAATDDIKSGRTAQAIAERFGIRKDAQPFQILEARVRNQAASS